MPALTTSRFGLSVLLNRWWGEKGFIRVQRHSSDKGEEGYCGTDYDPKQGHKSKKQLAEVNFDDFISFSSVFICFDYFSFQLDCRIFKQNSGVNLKLQVLAAKVALLHYLFVVCAASSRILSILKE